MGAHAQDDRQKVAYLKNGTVLRGKVVEQVFNESITIQTANGEKIKVPVSELKEVVIDENEEEADTVKHVRKIRPPFDYPGKQFFFQGECLLAYAEIGSRVIGGYRFGQFGILGLGIGVDGYTQGFQTNAATDAPFDGVYFPLFVHYEGDILKKMVTPFYAVEAGYAFRHSNDDSYIYVTPLNHPVYKNYGGFTGGVSFGVKVYTRHLLYVNCAAALDVKQAGDKYTNYYYNSIGEKISLAYSSASFLFMPGLKITVGF